MFFPASVKQPRRWSPRFPLLTVTAGLALLVCAAAVAPGERAWAADEDSTMSYLLEEDPKPIRAPELDGGVDWLNCGGPIRMKDLRGKIVLLDFWTYCCINCIHIAPDLAKLEKKYPNELVVIGVHSAKFDAEKDSKNIKEAILRYHIEHPVVNDADHKIWNAYAVRSWPTMYLIDPEGNIYGKGSGEGLYDLIDQAIQKLIKEHKEKKTLNEKPIRFDLAKFTERKNSALYFPGKILADGPGKRLFIADSSHHRIVVTDLDGKKLDVIGTGEDGMTNGAYDKATFNDPQGMALKGDTLYVADRRNHSIRAIDMKAKKVSTIAGTGKQSQDRKQKGDPLKVGLNSPWDLLLIGDDLYVAMAGHHQIWKLDLKNNQIAVFAGKGPENIEDGPKETSLFSQPSGLATDGKYLYVADSEVSAVRSIALDPKVDEVKTLVGIGLFDFGDVDAVGDNARLQHCLGVAVHNGKVLVADTYNNKIKMVCPVTKKCETLYGDGKPGKEDDKPRFDEPAGISIAGDTLYVADTNNHAVRVIDLKKKEVRTLKLAEVEPPTTAEVSKKPAFPNAIKLKLAETAIPKDGDLRLQVKLELPKGAKLNPLAPIQYLVEDGNGFEQMGKVEKSETAFAVKVPIAKLGDAKSLKVSVVYFYCLEGGEGVCQIQSHIWEIPVKPDAKAKDAIELTAKP